MQPDKRALDFAAGPPAHCSVPPLAVIGLRSLGFVDVPVACYVALGSSNTTQRAGSGPRRVPQSASVLLSCSSR